ncbi:MAG: DUF4350 domain-containing protein [Deltaproteobacteria bacterium]|nr:DUF4350 domain-containing protein [Deltaproteobacteria bacterium]
MRDRFPLLVAALLLFGVAVVWLFGEAGRRGTFADPLSTYRSAPDGARGLFLMAQRLGLPVTRRHVDLRDLDASKTGAVVLLGIHRLPKEELEPLKSFVSAGGRLVLVASPEPKERGLFDGFLQSESSLNEAFGVVVSACDSPQVERPLEVAVPSSLTRGVEVSEARVAGYLSREDGQPLLPLLLDPHADDRAVAMAFWHGEGRVVALSAPDLASNRALARADNARLWSSLLTAVASSGPIEFDEFHHGFTGERSISGYAARHGLHWAVLQLLLALWVWIAAQRRFGRARPASDEVRLAGADYLWAMARIYRQGGHRLHVVKALLEGLLRALGRKAGLGPRATVGEVVRALNRRGRPDLARALSAAEAGAAGASASDENVLAFARTCAGTRKLADHRAEDAAHHWFRLPTVRAALGLRKGSNSDRRTR